MADKGRKVPTEAALMRSRKDLGYAVAQYGPFKDAAKALNVTQRQLKKYLFQPGRTTLRGFWKSPAYRDLWRSTLRPIVEEEVEVEKTIERKNARTGKTDIRTYKVMEKRPVRKGRPTILGIKVPKITTTRSVNREGEITERVYFGGQAEEDRRASVYIHAVMLEHETPQASMSIAWQLYASQNGLPTSITEIQDMYANQELSKREVSTILNHWHAIYSDMDDSWYDDMVDSFAEYDYDGID